MTVELMALARASGAAQLFLAEQRYTPGPLRESD